MKYNCRRREMEQGKLCSTPVQRNKRREQFYVELQKKGNGTDEVMQYSYVEEQKKENSYEVYLLKKGNGTDEVIQYSCMEEQKKGNSCEIVNEEGKWTRQTKLCSTLVWRKQKNGNSYEVQLLKKGKGTGEVMQYSCMEEQKKRNSYVVQLLKKGNGSDEVMQYSFIEEQKKGNC